MIVRRIDCDVHCALPSLEELAEHLDPYWADYVRLRELKPPFAVHASYPGWWPMLATPQAETGLEALQAGPLRDVDHAILHCYFGVESFTHPYLAPALAAGINRWLQSAWLARDPRLLATACVTPQHPEAAVEEIERIATDPRFVQVMLPARAPGYGQQRYWPILEAAAAHGLAVAITYGGGSGIAPTPIAWPGSFFEAYVTAALPFQSHLASLLMSGIFERCPDLRIVFVESGWTWLPGFLWRIDDDWRAFQREVPWVKQPPSDYVPRHVRFTTQPTDAPAEAHELQEVAEQCGAGELLMYGSDYPHRHVAGVEAVLDAVPDAHRERVLGETAWEWYGIERRVDAAASAATT